MSDLEKKAGSSVDPFEKLRGMKKAFENRVQKHGSRKLRFCLDRSGSMSAYAGPISKMEAANRATAEMITRYRNRVEIKVYAFDEEVEDVVLDSVMNIDSRGGTDIGKPLSMLDAGCHSVLLSDGRGHGGREQIPRLVADGIVVHTIGVGSDIDEALLREIADATGGQFMHIGQDFKQIFDAMDALASKAVAALEAANPSAIAAGSGK